MKEFEALLENFWIIKEQDPDLYQEVKDASGALKPFIENKLGYRLIVTPQVIKMEKIPGLPEEWMGIDEFTTAQEYAFFCLLLVFLEDYGPQEQFVLSQVTEFIQTACPGDEKVDWTLYRHRIYLVRVLNFAAGMGLIKVDDGESSDFTTAVETEVLYESTGLSRYFTRGFSRNILSYTGWRDFENDEWVDMDPDRGAVRRHRVYRRLFLSPAVYARGPEDPDFLYIKNFRSMFQKEAAELIDGVLQIHKSCALLLLAPEKQFRETLPGQKVLSALAVQVCTEIRSLVAAGEPAVEGDDTLTFSRGRLEEIIDSCRRKYSPGWSKEFREMPPGRLYEEVISYMAGFSLLELVTDREVKILPLAGKLSGAYPEDFTRRLFAAAAGEKDGDGNGE